MRESCREWVEEKNDRCNDTACFILWGKLFPPEALGPRCWGHTSHWMNGYMSTADIDQSAIYDLRPVMSLEEEVGHLAFHLRQMTELVSRFDVAVEDLEDGHKSSPTVTGMKMVVDKVRARLPGETSDPDAKKVL